MSSDFLGFVRWRRRRDSNTPISPWVFQIFKGLPTCVPTRWCTNSDAAEMPSLHISENGRQPKHHAEHSWVAMPSEPDAEIHDRSLHSASTPRATHRVRFIQGAMGFERVAQRHLGVAPLRKCHSELLIEDRSQHSGVERWTPDPPPNGRNKLRVTHASTI